MARTITIEIQRPTSHVVEVGIERGAPKLLQSKTVTPTTQQQTVTPDSGFYGLNEVTVNAAPTQPLVVTPSKAQQIINPDSGYVGFEEVTVEAVTLQDKTVTPTEQVQVVEADEGYDGLNQVTVNAPAYPDLSWIMEAKVGNHPVVTAADMNKIKDYIAQDNGAAGLLAYANGVTSIDFGDVDEVGAWALGHFARNITTLVSVTFPALETINKERALYYAFAGSGVQSVSFSNLNNVSGSYALYQLCYNDTALTSVSFPNLISVSGSYAMSQMCYNDTALTSISFPNLESVSNNYTMYQMLQECTGLTSIIFPNLQSASGVKSLDMFQSCSNLEVINFPELTTLAGDYITLGYLTTNPAGTSSLTKLKQVLFPKLKTISSRVFDTCATNIPNIAILDFSSLTSSTGINRCFANAFKSTSLHTLRWGSFNTKTSTNCFGSFLANNSVKNFSCLAKALSYYHSSYPVLQTRLTGVTNLVIRDDASDNIYLNWQGSLTAASVKNVLECCNNSNMNGKSVTFKAGLTVTDDAEGSLAALKTAVTAQGCTINNLTINPYTP